MTPTELVTAFTTALAAAYTQGMDAYLDKEPRDRFDAVAPLLKGGWELQHPRWGSWNSRAPTAWPAWNTSPAGSTRPRS